MNQPLDMWYTRYRGQVQGPFTVDELRQRTQRGLFARHYEVSLDGVGWRRAADNPAFFEARIQSKLRSASASIEPQLNSGDAINASFATPLHALSSSSAEIRWLYAVGEDRRGPIPESELRSLLQRGAITADTLVWTDGWPDWVPADNVPNFMDVAISMSAKPTLPMSAGQSVGSGTPSNSGVSTSSLILGIVGLTLLLIAVGAAAGPKMASADSLSEDETQILLYSKWACAILALPPSILAIVLGHVGRVASAGTIGSARVQSLIGLILGYATLSPLLVGGVVALANVLVSD